MMDEILTSVKAMVEPYQKNWSSPVPLLEIRNKKSEDLSFFEKFDKHVGLYRFSFNGYVIYIGKTVEANNRSFWKRMSEYENFHKTKKFSAANAAKNNDNAMFLVNKYRDKVKVEFLDLGDKNTPKCDVEMMEAAYIYSHDPPLNKQFSTIRNDLVKLLDKIVQGQ